MSVIHVVSINLGKLIVLKFKEKLELWDASKMVCRCYRELLIRFVNLFIFDFIKFN